MLLTIKTANLLQYDLWFSVDLSIQPAIRTAGLITKWQFWTPARDPSRAGRQAGLGVTPPVS